MLRFVIISNKMVNFSPKIQETVIKNEVIKMFFLCKYRNASLCFPHIQTKIKNSYS